MGIHEAIAGVGEGVVAIAFLAFILYFASRRVNASFLQRYPGIRFWSSSLRFQTLAEEIRAKGWPWFLRSLLGNQKSWLTYWSFSWVIPLGFLVAAALASIQLPLIDLVQTGNVQNGWQAQLTITSLSFIVLIFLLDQISRSRYREGVIQDFFASSGVMPVIYFTLGSSGLAGYLYFYHSPNSQSPFIHDLTYVLFTGTVIGIGYVYYRVARLIFFDPLDEMTISQIKQGIDLRLREEDRTEISDGLLRQSLPEFAAVGTNRSGRVESAHELDLDGYIADIHLGKLRNTCEEYSDVFQGGEGASLFLNLGLGDEIQPGVDLISVDETIVDPQDLPDGFREGVAEAVFCSPDRPWNTGSQAFERNLGQIGEGTRKAINNQNPSTLEKYLGLYTDLLQYGTQLDQEQTAEDEITPKPVSDLINYIYRELRRILEAAVSTGSSELISTIRGEVFRISLAYHRQQETYLFDESISLYGYFYHVLAANNSTGQDEIQKILTNLDNILTMLAASLGRANTLQEAQYAVSDLDSFYGVLENILRNSIDMEDHETFNNAWHIGEDAFLTVNPDRDIFDLRRQIEMAAPDEDTEDLERKLEIKETKKESSEALTSQFDQTRFIAAAHAYQSVREGELADHVFEKMFSESIKNYSFNNLMETYFGLLGQPRVDLLRWESDDSDVFKGVRVSKPAFQTWLKDFFCAMGLLFLDEDQFDIDNLKEEDNPLTRLDVEKTEYPDLTDGIQDVSRSDLAKTSVDESELDNLDEKKKVFLTLHLQMQDLLERREEDRIIDADLDSEKVQNYRESYITGFEEQFILRNAFSDLGWFEPEDYDGQVDGFGFHSFYPKRGFIPDPPAEFIHNVDQRAGNHVDAIIERWLEENSEYLSESELDAYDAIPSEIDRLCSNLSPGEEPKAVIVGGFRTFRNLRISDYFDEDFQPYEEVVGGFSFAGGKVPVYKDSGREFEVLLLTGSNQPLEIKEYWRDDEPVYVSIEKVTRELLKELDPDEFKELSEEELRDRLQTVRMRIFHYSEFDAKEDFGTIITVTD